MWEGGYAWGVEIGEGVKWFERLSVGELCIRQKYVCFENQHIDR